MVTIESNHFIREFLAEGLPKGRVASDPHLQVFEKYIADSDERLQKIRNPKNDERRYYRDTLDRSKAGSGEQWAARVEISLSEYNNPRALAGTEIRFNRYEVSLEDHNAHFDIFLGRLWGLNKVTVIFPDAESRDRFVAPPSFLTEITGIGFFEGRNIAGVSTKDVQSFLAQ